MAFRTCTPQSKPPVTTTNLVRLALPILSSKNPEKWLAGFSFGILPSHPPPPLFWENHCQDVHFFDQGRGKIEVRPPSFRWLTFRGPSWVPKMSNRESVHVPNPDGDRTFTQKVGGKNPAQKKWSEIDLVDIKIWWGFMSA